LEIVIIKSIFKLEKTTISFTSLIR